MRRLILQVVGFVAIARLLGFLLDYTLGSR